MKRRSISLLAATLAATIIMAFLAGCSPANLDGAAKRAVAVKAISPHLPFGNPSEAGIEPNNQLVLRPQFAASWNAKKRISNWVAWRLVASDIGNTERSQFYRELSASHLDMLMIKIQTTHRKLTDDHRGRQRLLPRARA